MTHWRTKMTRLSLGCLFWLVAASVASAHPSTQATAQKTNQTKTSSHNRTSKAKRWLAQSKMNTPTNSTSTSKQADPVPGVAWTVESISAVLATGGFITLAMGATTLGRRDQIYNDFFNASSSPLGTAPTRPNAKEIKEMQDTGNALLITGLVVAGVGVVGMVVGAVWLIAHNPDKNSHSSSQATAQVPPPSSPGQRMTLLQLR